MAAVLVETAEAVKDALNDATTFNLEFTAERSYADWEIKLEDLDSLRVDVVPFVHDSSILRSRRQMEYECPIDIGIRKRFGDDSQSHNLGRIANDDVDELILLVEQVTEYFAAAELTGFADAVWSASSIRSTHNVEHLKEYQQFTGIVRVTFDVTKALT